jgi:hypothetical protein
MAVISRHSFFVVKNGLDKERQSWYLTVMDNLIENELYVIGKSLISERKLAASKPSPIHIVAASSEVYFTYAMPPEIAKDPRTGMEHTTPNTLRVIVQYRALQGAVIVLWRESNQSFHGVQLSATRARNFGGKNLLLRDDVKEQSTHADTKN